MTHIIAPITSSSVEGVFELGSRAFAAGATLVEVRMDGFDSLDPQELAGLRAMPDGKWIATLRSKEEGGRLDVDARTWLSAMTAAATSGAGWIDVEWRLLQLGILTREQVTGITESTGRVVGIILSRHDLGVFRSDPTPTFRRMESDFPSAIAKVVWNASNPRDSLLALELMREAPGRRIAIPMGEKGLPARLLAGKAQAFGTFCALDQSSATAPGQPLVAEAVGRYRILRQTPATQVLGVIGYPVGHSRGPALFNDQFAANGRDAVYVPFLVETAEELSDFLRACASSSWLGVRGFSVTLPHKEAALAWAGAKAEPLAARIGAVNTIRFNHGEMDAFNTDYVGILNTLRDRCELNGRSVAVLGAGGVARAAVAGLSDGGAVITIYNRASDRAHALAEEFGCNFAPWESRADLVADVVVNCTSLGMAPAVDETPLPASAFRTGMVVLDTVYTPAETRFVREAKAAGCIEVRGVEVFIQQAARQHELWFEEPLNVTRARQVLGVG